MQIRTHHSCLFGLWLALSPWLAQATPAAWPVAVAREGFSARQVDTLLREFAPAKLAAAGDQALYTYLNMAQFFPHQVVARQGDIRPLPMRPREDLLDLTAETPDGEISLADLLADPDSRLQGLLVLHRGQVVLERYPGMRPQDSHLWWSVAKVLAGVLTEVLIDAGEIDPAQDITSYLPEFADTGWDGASVDDVLNMASGIDALDTPKGYADPESGIGRLIHAEGILKAPEAQGVVGHDRALQMMRSIAAPGTRYQYSSANTNMLGLLIERVTGQSYADVVRQRIWSRIGAQGDGLLGMTPDGRPIAHGMYSSRLRDLGRFGLLFTPSGRQPDVLPPAVLQRMRDTGRNAHYRNAPGAAAWAERRLGERPVNALSQWDALFADGDLYKSGYDGQALYVSPGRDLVIAMFSTSKDRRAYRFLRPIAKAFPSVSDARRKRRDIFRRGF